MIKKSYIMFIFLVTLMGTGGIVNAESSTKNYSSNLEQKEEELPSFSSYTADSTTYVSEPQAVGIYSTIGKQLNEKYGVTVFKWDFTKNTIIFSNEEFERLDLMDRRDLINSALKQVKEAKMTPKGRNKLYNFISGQDSGASKVANRLNTDVRPDLVTGKKWFAPFNNWFTTLLGVVALGVFIATGISVVVDIAYITVPMFRYKYDESDFKLKWVSPESFSSVMEGDKKIPIGVYLKRRSVVLILMMVSLAYLASGFLYDVLDKIMSVTGLF